MIYAENMLRFDSPKNYYDEEYRYHVRNFYGGSRCHDDDNTYYRRERSRRHDDDDVYYRKERFCKQNAYMNYQNNRSHIERDNDNY